MEIKSLENLSRYSAVVIAAIAEHYEVGKITDRRENHQIMSMFALLCEGKISGHVPKTQPLSPVWRLTDTDDDIFD